MSLDPDDIGIDLGKILLECAACRKKSDSAIPISTRGIWLCCAHWDEWVRSGEEFTPFVTRLRSTTYAACWAATPLDPPP